MPRILLNNFLCSPLEISPLFSKSSGIQFRRRVSVAIVRADHQRILAHAALDQVRHVVADLTGHEDAAALQQIIR